MFADISETDQLKYKINVLEYHIEQLNSKSSETFNLKTTEGQIKGVQRRTLYGDLYYSFERIPYAQPPLGELRFRAPKPITPWKGVLDCTHYGPRPLQRDPIAGNIIGDEDCLFLNVYTNDLNVSKPRPVMIWIYGGGFQIGEATRECYGPDYFMKEDVVLVTIQYRLGALGFLSLDDPQLDTPGNAGIKDQIMAIKWIKKNCAAFGGDPECITVFGESAGAVSVHALMLSEQAKGLFHRAILQSGVSVMNWDVLEGDEHALLLAQSAGYTGNKDSRQALEYLTNCPAEEILEAEKKCQAKMQRAVSFGPRAEPYVTSHTLTNKAFKDSLENAWGNSIPLLIGSNSNEGLMFLPLAQKCPDIVQAQLATCESYVPKEALSQPDNAAERRDKGLVLRKLHISGEVPTNEEFFDIIAYAYFLHPIHKAVRPRLQQHHTIKNASTYLYRFDFDSEKLLQPFRMLRAGMGVSGVAHADDLTCLFSNVLSRRMDRQSREYRTIERMIGLWTTFAATGNPNTDKINGMEGIKWQPLCRAGLDFNADNADNDATKAAARASGASGASGATATVTPWKCLNIGDELKFMDLPEWSKLCVWQQLYDNDGHNQLTEKAEHVDVPAYAKATL